MKTYELLLDGDGLRVKQHPEENLRPGETWRQLDSVRALLTIETLGAKPKITGLHACVVKRGGRSLLLVGEPYSGKTTLLLELLGDGWTYVSDDLAPITSEGHLLPFPKPISIRDLGRWRALAQDWAAARELPPPESVGLLPPEVFGPPATDAPRPTWIVFPRFRTGAAPTAKKLPPALAASKCLLNCRLMGGQAPAALGVFGRLCSEASAWAIEYGSSKDAIRLMSQEIDAI